MAVFIKTGAGDIRQNIILNISNVNVPGYPSVDHLRTHVVDEAMHDSGEVNEQGDCHPGTRVSVQQVIAHWADNHHPRFFINWLFGAAGAGKSAIMRTVAKVLEAEGKLLGSFFCVRSSRRRSNGFLVIPTIVEQMICHIPSLRPFVQQAFDVDPGLLAKTMTTQAMRLIVEPLNSIDPAERAGLPYIILLDGIDEINGFASQECLIKTLAFINDQLDAPLHFLIASRPEPPIHVAFDKFMPRRWSPLELDELFKPDEDIDVFYIYHFQTIRDGGAHYNLAPGWPGLPVRRQLVVKGSGQFIFAATVIGVVGDPSSPLTPQERLDLVLEVTKRDDLRPLERLDLLYVTVLNQIPKSARTKVLHILGLILMPDILLKTPEGLDTLFCYSHGTTRQRVCQLHSVLKVPKNDTDAFSSLHATLGDFIFDKTRSGQFGFHVNKEELRRDLLVRIVTAVLSFPEWMCGLFSLWGSHFLAELDRISPGPCTDKILDALLKCEHSLSTLHPTALMGVAESIVYHLIKTSPFHSQALLGIQQSIDIELKRRAQSYLTDCGELGPVLISLGCWHAAHGITPVKCRGRNSRSAFLGLWTSIIEMLWTGTEVEVQQIETKDEHFGLGILSSWPWDFKISGLLHPGVPRIWFKYLFSYGHLLVDDDMVKAAIHHHWDGQPRDPIINAFWDALPLNNVITTWLRDRLSTSTTVIPYSVDPRVSARFFLCGTQRYIKRHSDRAKCLRSFWELEKEWRKALLAAGPELVEELGLKSMSLVERRRRWWYVSTNLKF